MTPLLSILALDMSSTAIGVVVADGARVREHTTWQLAGDIAQRCVSVQGLLRSQLANTPDIDLIVIEAPVGRFAKALIPQARVSGAVLAVLAETGIAWVEIAPAAAKRALCGKGTAKKPEMIAAASLHFLPGSEHEADAYALSIAAQELKILKEAA